MESDSSIEKRATRRFRSRRAMMVTVLIIALAVSFAFLYSLLDGHHTTAPSPRPSLVGWGGVALNEVTRTASGNPVSSVFPGETASDLEYVVQVLQARGFNTVRVDFDPYCTDMTNYNSMSVYSQTNAQRAVQIAQQYGFWIIIDYHGYSDIFRNTSCWLNYWKPIVQNIGPMYSRIIWEPENEPTTDCSNSPSSCPSAPCSSDSSCVTYLGNAYQQWINQTRSTGDTHWIVVQSICSYGCGLCPNGTGDCPSAVDGYPIVTDPAGHIFLSIHSYMSYSYYSNSWNTTTATAVANGYYQAVLSASTKYGWPALNTEGGADPLCAPCASPPPDTELSGSAGYTTVTLSFIQTLTNLYDANTPARISWVWWPAGDWTDTTTSPLGTLDCDSSPQGWGCQLKSLPATT